MSFLLAHPSLVQVPCAVVGTHGTTVSSSGEEGVGQGGSTVDDSDEVIGCKRGNVGGRYTVVVALGKEHVLRVDAFSR